MVVVTLAIYDVSCNRLRARLENVCKDCGLIRVQKSAFRGDISQHQRDKLCQKMSEALQGEEGYDVQIYFICDKDFASYERLNSEGLASEPNDKEEVLIV